MNLIAQDLRIDELIYSVRGKQVILDRDLALLYQVEVAQMNRQVKRNKERFPDDFIRSLEVFACQKHLHGTVPSVRNF